MVRAKRHLGIDGKKVGIYIRVSTEEQKRSGFSPGGQKSTCRDVITRKGLKEIDIYEDLACSGTVKYEDREGFARLLYDIQIKKIDVVIFQMFDRLARSNVIAYSMVDIFENYGIRLIECQHDCDSGTTSMTMFKMTMGMCFTFSETEHSMIRERSINGTYSKRAKLGWSGGGIPYGYKKKDKDKDSIPIANEIETKVINIIYDFYWNKEYTLQKICDYLNDHKINTRKVGKKSGIWKPTTIMGILKTHRDKYYGSLINNNENGITWPKLLNIEYPIYPRSFNFVLKDNF